MQKKLWYALKVRGGREEKIKRSILQNFEEMGATDALGELQVPFRRTYTAHQSKRVIRKRYFGYMFIKVDLTVSKARESLLNTEGVSGFVTYDGWSRKVEPIPLKVEEVERMMGGAEVDTHSNEVDVPFHEGEEIEIVDGIFKGKRAIIQAKDHERKKLSVLLSLFQSEIPVDLNYNQVKKNNS